MAIINNTYNFIFFHIPKSAGTSLSTYYSKLTRINDVEIGGSEKGTAYLDTHLKFYPVSNHITPAQLIEILDDGNQTFERYFSFAFVRNPFDRVIALWNFWHRWIPKTISQGIAYQNFIDLYDQMKKHTEISSFIESDYRNGPDIHNVLHGQTHWTHGADGKPYLSKWYKVEDIDKSVTDINMRLGISLPPFEIRLNAAPEKADKYLSSGAIECIQQKYKQDFRLLEYETSWPAY